MKPYNRVHLLLLYFVFLALGWLEIVSVRKEHSSSTWKCCDKKRQPVPSSVVCFYTLQLSITHHKESWVMANLDSFSFSAHSVILLHGSWDAHFQGVRMLTGSDAEMCQPTSSVLDPMPQPGWESSEGCSLD